MNAERQRVLGDLAVAARAAVHAEISVVEIAATAGVTRVTIQRLLSREPEGG